MRLPYSSTAGFINFGRELGAQQVKGAKVVAAHASSPGLSRRSRSGGHSAPIIEMAETSPAMTK
jgi:hypothetical protein